LPNYVYTDHTHLANLRNPYFGKTDLYSERWIELERTIYHNATLVFTRTGDVSQSVIEDYGCSREKVFCVYAGSNLSNNFEVDVRRYENKEILFVGFDWERKGGPELIEAFKRVLQVYPDARLVIVGCSPRIRIRNCDVVGVVPLKDLDYYYKKASLFCLPTKIEPSFPIVCLEAFAHGLPVVATNVEGMADIVREEETGYLVKPGDVASLSEVLTRLLGNSEKCRILGENGRRLVLTKYNWENVGAEIARNIVATLGRAK
jgi:glycosyltransferase involved in cell wall biosynthesis